MAIQKINLGTEPHGVGGDSYRTANEKINSNFEEVGKDIQDVLDVVMTGDFSKTAYDIAVKNGFVGSEQEWLESLRGYDGISAYEVAKNNGFIGSEAQWLNSLIGEKGERGVGLAHVSHNSDDTLTFLFTDNTSYTTNSLKGDQGIQGPEAKSVYDIAVSHGFVGNEEDWLNYILENSSTVTDLFADADSLEQFINGSDSETVLTRLSAEYPTLQKAIKQMFENGGLPATPFKTKADMEASELVDDDYAMVTEDTDNNGLYVKTAGAWVKSGYDPLAQAKSYTDTAKTEAISIAEGDATTKANTAKSEAIAAAAIDAENKAKAVFKENDVGQYFDASAFSIEAHYNRFGKYTAGSPFLQTDFVAVKKGDVITASTGMPIDYPWGVMFDTSQTRTGNLGVVTERVFKERTATVMQDGFVVIQHASTIEPDSVPKFEINKGKPKYVELTKLADNDAIKAKADKIKLNYFTDFEVGGTTVTGDKTSETDRIRSKSIYKLKAGTVIKFSKMTNNYLFGVAAISEEDYAAGKFPYTTYISHATSPGYTFTVTEDEPYVMVFVRANPGGINPITPDDIPTILEDVKIWTEESVSYTSPIVTVSGVTSTTGYLPPITTPSPFRSSSLATGGVISFIDDDGKAEVLAGLHPFMKGEGVPYGEAIVPARLDTDGYMTTEQFLQLANETEHVEILDHTFSHFNLSSATKERIEGSLLDSKKFFASNGVVVDSLVYPFGGDGEPSRAIVAKYYQAAFDYGAQGRVETFDTISNRSIKRTTWQGKVDTVAYHKTKIDQAAANNGWLVICLHVGANTYWYENSYAELSEIIAYAREKGLRFAMPRDGFQIFGNIAENDSGFRIQANGKIVGAS